MPIAVLYWVGLWRPAAQLIYNRSAAGQPHLAAPAGRSSHHPLHDIILPAPAAALPAD